MLNRVQWLLYKLLDSIENSRTLLYNFLSGKDLLKNPYISSVKENLTFFENSIKKYSPFTIIISTLLILYLLVSLSEKIGKLWKSMSKKVFNF
jgi:hypothetical protein